MSEPPIPRAQAEKHWALHVRKLDGSCFISHGDYQHSQGQAFDVACGMKTGQLIVDSLNEAPALQAQNARLREALADTASALESIPIPIDSPYWGFRDRRVQAARQALSAP